MESNSRIDAIVPLFGSDFELVLEKGNSNISTILSISYKRNRYFLFCSERFSKTSGFSEQLLRELREAVVAICNNNTSLINRKI
jgi:hypothetical protein